MFNLRQHLEVFGPYIVDLVHLPLKCVVVINGGGNGVVESRCVIVRSWLLPNLIFHASLLFAISMKDTEFAIDVVMSWV